MVEIILLSAGIIGVFLLAVLFVGLVVMVVLDAANQRRADVILALLVVALLAYYVGYRVGGL